MSISCDCDYDGDDFIEIPNDFSLMPKRSRRCRCGSCKNLIDAGAVVLAVPHFRESRDDIEERIYGNEVPLASIYLCERCGEILLNLNAAGLCVCLDGNLEKDLRQYWEMTGFDPEKYQQAVEGA